LRFPDEFIREGHYIDTGRQLRIKQYYWGVIKKTFLYKYHNKAKYNDSLQASGAFHFYSWILNFSKELMIVSQLA